MSFKHDELPYHKFVYGYEIVMPDPYDYSSYRFILHRFLNKRERGLWLQAGNRGHFYSPRMQGNKRRNKVSYSNPMVQAAKHCHNWPVTIVDDGNGKYRVFRRLTGSTDPGIK